MGRFVGAEVARGRVRAEVVVDVVAARLVQSLAELSMIAGVGVAGVACRSVALLSFGSRADERVQRHAAAVRDVAEVCRCRSSTGCRRATITMLDSLSTPPIGARRSGASSFGAGAAWLYATVLKRKSPTVAPWKCTAPLSTWRCRCRRRSYCGSRSGCSYWRRSLERRPGRAVGRERAALDRQRARRRGYAFVRVVADDLVVELERRAGAAYAGIVLRAGRPSARRARRHRR